MSEEISGIIEFLSTISVTDFRNEVANFLELLGLGDYSKTSASILLAIVVAIVVSGYIFADKDENSAANDSANVDNKIQKTEDINK
jgi:hypothetical protein